MANCPGRRGSLSIIEAFGAFYEWAIENNIDPDDIKIVIETLMPEPVRYAITSDLYKYNLLEFYTGNRSEVANIHGIKFEIRSPSPREEEKRYVRKYLDPAEEYNAPYPFNMGIRKRGPEGWK